MNFLDYTQFSSWLRCPWYWHERYINKRVMRRDGQQDDALTLGSLVHNGLENWSKNQQPTIDNAVVEEQCPTPTCLQDAQFLLHEYIRRYPSTQWPLQFMEEPCLFSIGVDEWRGMAKVDKYFRVPELSELPANEEGHTFTLEEGIWIQEYKTKGQSISRANWILDWEMNRQASFQLLALRERFGNEVRGIVVDVLEKPREYTPRRKCKGCGEQYELASFIPRGEDGHECMVCGTIQKLSPYKPTKDRNPSFFRVKVTRTDRQLDEHRHEILNVATDMQAAMDIGIHHFVQNSRECVHRQYGACEYLNNHLYNISTKEDGRMMDKDTTKYMGLTIL